MRIGGIVQRGGDVVRRDGLEVLAVLVLVVGAVVALAELLARWGAP